MDVRRPSVAGQFYEGTAQSLRAQIEKCFVSKLGPGSIPAEAGQTERILGVVVPHAGYVYSGPVAAWSYSALFLDSRPDTFVILGPNHHGVGSGVSLFPEGAWETPLGNAWIDNELAGKIVENTAIIDMDKRAHAYEHSIEVQIPFLQYLFGEIRFVPIMMMMQDPETSMEVGLDIAKAVERLNKKAVIIASTDFSHYVTREVADENDHAAIEKIVSMDAAGLYNVVEERRISMCGYGPVMAAIEATSRLGATKGELLKYATSGDVSPMRDVVGYASISLSRD